MVKLNITELPRISIIIPVYNVEPYIADCLQSVMCQTYKGTIECILVDDCGTDDSMQIAELLIAEYNGPVEFKVLHHERNRGLSAARNTGTEAAKGEYIYYLDSDDWIDDNSIATLYKAIVSGDYAIAISYFTAYFNAKNSVYNPQWLFTEPRVIQSEQFAERMLMQQSNFASTAKLYKKEILTDVRFREGRLNEDTLFVVDMISVIESQNLKCIDIPLYAYHYRMRDESICHKSMHKMDACYIEHIQIAIDKYRERQELVNWLHTDQVRRSMKVFRDKLADYNSYNVAGRCVRNADKKFLKEIVIKRKTYIHILLFAYLPIIMWGKNQIQRIIKEIL